MATVLAPLELLRRRLLDLTRRNSLLNFKHPKSSLRIIDELPDQLFHELSEGKKFVMTPVPQPPKFKDAPAKIQDMYPERAGQRVRPDVVEWAKHSGIRTDYELPTEATDEDNRHRDKKIQTLLYPEDLEAHLANIGSMARTMMEEMGVNVLYLAFGFLSWTDQEEGKPNLAPLMLLPVTLTRNGIDSATRRYKYEIEYSGEDIEANISLIEKLRSDFALELPALEDEEPPDAYMKRCRKILATKPEWKFHRQVTLGMFQFGKLLMYLDLDPANWPADHQIDQHEIISGILDGETGGTTEFAPVHDVDDLLPDTPEFQLVIEADSTQHSAVMDAAEGKNLVIEGPPGTGKSQTITNIIAVALNQGKSVLFVAEKLAALKVVKDRLDKLGLGNFCLELHSNRANKKRFYEEMKKRCEMPLERFAQGTLTLKLADLQKSRIALNEYAVLVNTQAPDLDITYHELFCRTVRLKELLGTISPPTATLKQNDTAKLDENWLRALESRISRAKVFRTDITHKYGTLDAHPWSYLVPKSKKEAGADPAAEIRGWRSLLQTLKASAAPLCATGVAPGDLSLTTLGDIAKVQGQLSDPSVLPVGPLTKILKAEGEFKLLVAYGRSEQAFTERHKQLGTLYSAQYLLDQAWLTSVIDACGSLKSLPISVINGPYIAGLFVSQLVADYVASQEDASKVLQEVEAHLGVRPGAGIEVLRASASVLRCAITFPRKSLEYRYPGLEQVSDLKAVQNLAGEIHVLSRDKERAELAFDFDIARWDGRMSAAAEILQAGGFFSFLDGRWRSANDLYKQVCRNPSWFKSSRAKGDELADLLTLRKNITALENNPKHSALLGSGFKGLSTRIDDYVKLVTWFEEVRAAVGMHGKHTAISLAMVNLPEEKLEALQRCSLSNGGSVLDHVVSTIAAMRKPMPEAEVQAVVGDPMVKSPAAAWLPGLQKALDTIGTGLLAKEEKISVVYENARHQFGHLTDKERIGKRADYGLESQGVAPLNDQGLIALKGMLEWGMALWGSPSADVLRTAYLASLSSSKLAADYASLSAFRKASGEEAEAYKALAEKYQISFGPVSADPQPRTATLDVMDARLKASLDHAAEWESWAAYTTAIHEIGELDASLKGPARSYHRGEYTDEQLQAVSEYLYYNTHATVAKTAHSEFENFETNVHESMRSKFAKLDEEVTLLHRKLIVSNLLRRDVPMGRGGRVVGEMTEMSLLTHNIGKQRPRTTMRQVMVKSGRAIQALKPCFMMGPLSVAQFLKPGHIHFDLIVMDEASQMRPEDAIGAVARGSQLIVVGDPNQLPPTVFFDHMEEDDGPADEELAVADKESILDMATPLFQPVRRLGWHYRSKHETLIAFSNKHFYNSSLMLFPSAHARSEGLGIHYTYINQGICADSVNVREAREVVLATIKEIKRTGGKLSVGIVAMNIKQMQAIRDEWDRQLRERPELQEMVEKLGGGMEGEPFFIKNLETVQGDERDIIVLSMTYGPHSETSREFHQRFGPINSAGGWRRLNVLFTRARRKMMVLSSMYSDGVTGSSRGAQALKGFLAYCETERLQDQAVETGRPPANDFEEQVAAIVENAGFKAVPQVGICGYFVDIGVMHEAVPGKYLLGIECDGAPYHSVKSARDRDRLRENIIRDMGWNIHRVWSPDWFHRAGSEKRRLAAVLERLRDMLPEMKAPLVVAQVQEPKRDPDVLKSKLRELRSIIEVDLPDVPAGRRLLRDEVLDHLVTRKPTSYDEFTGYVPEALRKQVDPGEAKTYLGAVLSLIDEYS